MIDIMIDLQGGAKAPLYEKIYRHIKNEIVEGRIPRGEKLPSTRHLARNLGVSRSTASLAYDQLLAEGYIEAESCRGFFVCDITELYRLGAGSRGGGDWSLGESETAGKEDWGRNTRRELKAGSDAWCAGAEDGPSKLPALDFSPYLIDTKHFPYNIWRKISRNVLLDDREDLLLAGDGQGEWELRGVIAGYLHQARGVNCSPADIILGAGNEYLEILLTQILGAGRAVLMEDPGYPQAHRTFSNAGYRVETVAAGDGLTVDRVRQINPDLVYVMPSHQFPIGTIMPLGLRLELLRWAAEAKERYIVEDDHDSEYRYRGKPIPALQSVDGCGKVIYLGTFSKSIAPALRISYMVLPPQLMERYHDVCGFYSATVPRMQQETLKEFMREGHFERHLNKMRGIYRNRHDFLLGELKRRGWAQKISGEHAGLHLLVQVDTVLSEDEICRSARERGVKLSGISRYRLAEADRGRKEKKGAGQTTLLLGYGKLSEEQICRGLMILDEILERAQKGE